MTKIILKKDWLFKELGAASYETVTVPHTVKLEELHVYNNYKSVFEYKKTVTFDDSDKNNNIFIHFDGVMTNCEVFFNDVSVAKHYGGYLPFIINITDKIIFNKENIIKVIVDNHDDKRTPPGKPSDGLDFLYYGGIYRNVSIIKKPFAYITDPLESENNGGVVFFARKKDNFYTAEVTAFCKSTLAKTASFSVTCEIKDTKNASVAIATKKITISPNKVVLCNFSLQNLAVKEWHIDAPTLYNLTITISDGAKISYSETSEIGFRTAKVSSDGFYLNDVKMELFGTNRHQQYPYIGIAASENAQRREARLLKQSGVNTLRLAHYPESPAFLSECDRQGIIVIDCVPGWQFWGGAVWQARLRQNLIDMIRRDRNHAACIIYEITPNETYSFSNKGDAYFRNFIKIAHNELPTILVSGDTLGRLRPASIPFDIPHTGNNKVGKFYKWLRNLPERLPLMREYGDWLFGGNNSTSRVSRGDSEFKQQVQAWNFQWTYNSSNVEKKLVGSLTWEGIDHNRGYFPLEGISKSGYLDIFRLKKFTYYFIKSQKIPVCEDEVVVFPVINTLQNKTKIPVYSNCKHIKVYNGDLLIAEKDCDNGATIPYDSKKLGKINEAYWLTATDHIATSEQVCNEAKHTIACLFDGGNCEAMRYPPFTFTGLQLDGVKSLTFKGYIGGKEVKSYTFTEPQQATTLTIEVSDNNIPLENDDNDCVFVYVVAKDKNGVIDYTYNKNVSLTVVGGEAIFTNTIMAEAGIASFLVKAHTASHSVALTATDGEIVASLDKNIIS